MTIELVIIRNFKGLKETELTFGKGVNILVGDNETGKSTVLEAINLALTKQLNRRDVRYDLHPFLFHQSIVQDFVQSVRNGSVVQPLQIEIEIYLTDIPALAEHKGTNNSRNADCPGVRLSIELDEKFGEEYQAYITDTERIRTVPVEFYHVDWRNFADEPLTSRAKPIQPALIDPSALTNTYAASRYVLELARDFLTRRQKVDLALSYRHLREVFQGDANVARINQELAKQQGVVSDRELSVALDMTARSSWDTSVTPHLDDLPLTLVGKGEQTSVKVKLALEASEACEVLLIEEPETHQSPGNLNRLLAHIAERVGDKQVILTTHSSFVLNKLGIDATIMFDGKGGVRLRDLPDSTKRYFMKLPGHDTLRMVLAKRTILVEGPSDELIVQRAYSQVHGTMPLEDQVEVISVNSLAFKRFLDIAVLLDLDVTVVTDNDGDPEKVRAKYAEYAEYMNISVCYSNDAALRTLEPNLVESNGHEAINAILGTDYMDIEALIAHMEGNKADTALKLFESPEDFAIPEYIRDAVR
ncbi:MAG: AAA family ATPase [Gammaproteobacteria bacterium]|nr:AAA family ATPase [Gammaproteobacteria bacterium]MDE0413758.1 AAA family ATPase [Gammaproteobacteria bacterium]